MINHDRGRNDRGADTCNAMINDVNYLMPINKKFDFLQTPELVQVPFLSYRKENLGTGAERFCPNIGLTSELRFRAIVFNRRG